MNDASASESFQGRKSEFVFGPLHRYFVVLPWTSTLAAFMCSQLRKRQKYREVKHHLPVGQEKDECGGQSGPPLTFFQMPASLQTCTEE